MYIFTVYRITIYVIIRANESFDVFNISVYLSSNIKLSSSGIRSLTMKLSLFPILLDTYLTLYNIKSDAENSKKDSIASVLKSCLPFLKNSIWNPGFVANYAITRADNTFLDTGQLFTDLSKWTYMIAVRRLTKNIIKRNLTYFL